MRISFRLLGLLLAASLTACLPTDLGPGTNPFIGCYDRSCVGAPVLVSGVPPLTTVSTYSAHVCGLTDAGEAWCWGDNEYGQLGDGTDQPRSAPVRVAGELRFSAITTAMSGTCAISADSTAYCWGAGGNGDLARPAPDACGPARVPCAKSPLAIEGRSYTAIASGARHTCAIATDGSAYCWGFNFLGETGSSAYATSMATPHRVPGTQRFAVIGAGDSFTCALTTEGKAWCWGSANRGELGTPAGICSTVFGFPNYCSPTPRAANTPSAFAMLSVGQSHVCALTPDGTALCWGDNGQGQLGTLRYDTPDSPVLAHGGMRFATIDASTSATCGTPLSGPSVCWGLNLMGKLGVGTRVELSPRPLAIAGDRRYTAMAGGQMHVCGLTASGAAYCWGSGGAGQLGAGPRTP